MLERRDVDGIRINIIKLQGRGERERERNREEKEEGTLRKDETDGGYSPRMPSWLLLFLDLRTDAPWMS